jgi:hypothetical protein
MMSPEGVEAETARSAEVPPAPPPTQARSSAPGWKGANWKGRLKLIIFSLLPVALLFFTAEMAAHLITKRHFEEVQDPLTGGTWYTMTTGLLPWSPSSTTLLNSHGLPDDEYVNVLPKGDCVHIVVAGDSFTFGDAVNRERSYFQLVKGASAIRHPDRCLRFFNVAQRMTTIEQQAARVRETWHLLQPDLVIIGQYQNDLTDLTNPGSILHVPTEGRHAVHWGDRLSFSVPGYTNALARMLTYRAFAFMIQNGIAYDVLRKWSALEDDANSDYAALLKSTYRDLFAEFVADMGTRGVEVGVVIMPSKMDVLAKRYPEGEFFEALAREFAIPHLSVMPALMANRRPYAFQMYDGHLSEAGNRLVAGEVVRWLFDGDRAFAVLARDGSDR